MGAQDVEAGRAYVSLYLRRTQYDRQVDELDRDKSQADDRPSQAIASQTEAGISVPDEIAKGMLRGAAGRAGGVALVKLLPMFREVGMAATGTAASVAAVGTAAATSAPIMATLATSAATAAPAVAATGTAAATTAPTVAAVGTAAAATAPPIMATAVASTAAAPAIAATGTAAAGASVGFGAMMASLAPILIPLAAIAAVAGTVYVAIFKWEKLPIIVRLLALAFVPLVAVVRLAVNAFKLFMLAIKTIFLPITLAVKAVNFLVAAVTALPRAIAAIPGLMYRVAGAAWEMGKKVASAAKTMAVEVGKAVAATAATLAKVPGRLAGYAASAVEGVSSAVRGFGVGLAKIGGVAAGLSAAIVGPMTLAAKSWGAYGERIRDVQNQLLRFELSAEEASIIARVNAQTGESMEKLAQQMRDGTRDFSRWQNEMRNSGTLMSGAGLSAALALSRAYYSLRESVVGLKNAIGAALGPSLTESAQMMAGLIQGVARWVSQNKPLVAQIFKIASAVGIAATAVVTLGGAIAGAGAALTPFTAALAAIAGGLALVEVRTEAGRSVWSAYGESVRHVYHTVVQYLGQMAEFAGRVIGGIKDALIAGDLAAAVDVMWAGAKAAWFAALQEIDALTSGVFGGIFQSLAAGRWSAAGEGAMNALQQAWVAGIGLLSGLWDQVVDAADTAWAAIVNAADTAWTNILIGFDFLMGEMKKSLSDALGWMSEKMLPTVVWLQQHAPEAVGALATMARVQLNTTKNEIDESLAKPQEGPTREEEAEARKADRAADFDARKAAREGAADDARLAREQKIEALRQRQADLAADATTEAEQERSANQRALDAAIAAAKAARDAADAGRLNEENFAVSQETKSIVQFSGEAMGLAVGRSDDPARKTAKLNEEQLKELKTIAKELGVTLREVLRLQAMGGFA